MRSICISMMINTQSVRLLFYPFYSIARNIAFIMAKGNGAWLIGRRLIT